MRKGSRVGLSLSPATYKTKGQQVDIVLSVAAQMKKGVDPQKAIDAVNLQMSTLSKQTDAAWTAIGLTACLG